jgi:hypothetical protein
MGFCAVSARRFVSPPVARRASTRGRQSAWRAIRAYRFFHAPRASDAAQRDVAERDAIRHHC